MSKLQFLLAENPLKIDQGVFVLHCQYPHILIGIIHRDEHPEYITPEHNFFIEFMYNDEAILLVIHSIFNVNEFTEAIAIQDDLFRVLNRAKRWYIEYLKWEDSQ